MIWYFYTLQNDHNKSIANLVQFSKTKVTIQSYYNIVDYIPHAVHFIPMTHLFYNWKFVPLNLPHLFHSSPHTPPLWQPPVCSLYLWVCFCFVTFVHLFCFLDSVYKWNHTVFVFLWLISLNIIPSRSIDVVANGKDFILFCGWVIFHCVHTPHLLYPFLYRWTLRLLLYLGYYKLCCNEHRGADIFLS